MGRICRKNILDQKLIRIMINLSGKDLLEVGLLDVIILKVILKSRTTSCGS